MTTNAPTRPGALRVLVVEDHQDCAESTAQLLRLFGHEVEIARTGPAALRAAEARLPDVVLLDICLPGMSGYKVASELKGRQAAGRQVLVIAVTGLGQEADRQRSFESGIDLHLVKPVDPKHLREVLQLFEDRVVNRLG